MMNPTMKKLLATLALVVGMFMLAGACHAEPGSEGTEFYLGFTPNFGSTGALSLIVSGEQDTKFTVEIPFLNFKKEYALLANEIVTVPLPKDAQKLPINQVSQFGVHVVAEKKISVYGFNRDVRLSDGFLALPVDALGLEYYPLNYPGFTSSHVLIVGAHDNTKVTVTPMSGSPFVVTLNRGSTYFMYGNGEMSSTRIVADAPVGVLSAVGSAKIPHGYTAQDYLVEMVPPVSSWGKSFLTVPLATRLKGDLFRVMAAEDNTRVFIDGALKTTLARGKFYEAFLTTRSQITTSAPVLLMQFAVGTQYDGVEADPFSMVIPPTEQFLDHYTISTPNDTGYPRQFVNIVIPSGEVGELRLDGAAVDAKYFSAIGNSGFSGGQVPLPPGTHALRSNGTPFGIYVYGFGFNEGYGYPGGMSFKAINPIGDPFAPGLRLVAMGDVVQGRAADSEDGNANDALDPGEDLNGNASIDRRTEDKNANGKLDPGEDSNGNGILDQDSGVFRVELLPGASNLRLDIVPFIPGAKAVQFSVARVDLTKPGVGTVQLTDGAGNKATGPIAIATIPVMNNVRAVATVASPGIEVDVASFVKQPFSITKGALQQVIEWRFDTFSVDTAADLSFDVVLKNPLGGEKRLVSQQFDLYYTDHNGKEQHTALTPRYVEVLPASFTIAPSTDKASYAAGENVHIASLVKSLGTAANSPGVRLSVRDANNALVAALGQLPAQTIDAGASVTFRGLDFNVGASRAGSYTLVAEVVGSNNDVLAAGSVAFSVEASAGASLSVTIATDRQVYAPHDTVAMSDRLTSLSQNTALNGLRVVTEVINTDGTVRMSKTETVAQLAPNGSSEFRYGLPLGQAPAGQYSATVKVSNGDGQVLAQSSTRFSVSSSADTGSGLVGTITALPARVPKGESLALAYSATNLGNSVLAELPLKVSIVDPVAQKVLAEFPVTRTLAIGAVHQADLNWSADGNVGDTYVALLSASVAGQSLTLAQASFVLVEPPVKLDIRQALTGASRLLVLVSCNAGDDDAAGADGKPAVCASERMVAIGTMLSGLGVTHQIVSDEAAFKLALRSGSFNAYWISGKQDKLHDDLAAEVRELVYGGDTLILDGVHDERNQVLDAVSAILYRGKVGETALAVEIGGPAFEPQRLSTAGRALSIELDGAVRQASFAGTHPTAHGPAIVTHAYGKGQGVLFAFDLVASYLVEPQWQPVMSRALKHAAPAVPAVITPGGLLLVHTSVANLAQALDVQVRSTLPPGAVALATLPGATLDASAGALTWTFPLAVGQTQDVQLALRAPMLPGSSSMVTVVSALRDGVVKPYGEQLVLPLTVAGAAATSAAVHDALGALPLTRNQDEKARDAVAARLQTAMASFKLNTSNDYAAAVGELVDASEQLLAITEVDTSTVRLGIVRLLKEAQSRWMHMQPAATTQP